MQMVIAALSLWVFIWLALMSREPEVGYKTSEFHVLDKKQSQAEVLKDVWQLSEEDISKPVVLWKK